MVENLDYYLEIYLCQMWNNEEHAYVSMRGISRRTKLRRKLEAGYSSIEEERRKFARELISFFHKRS